jgi:multicomponent Na+:H+ antiporter subunit G
MSLVGAVLLGLGALLLVLAAWGVIVLPDALARQHAATKAGTLALALVCIGAGLLMPQAEWAWRLALILGFLLATLPVASHLLARAAVREAGMAEAVRHAPRVGGQGQRRVKPRRRWVQGSRIRHRRPGSMPRPSTAAADPSAPAPGSARAGAARPWPADWPTPVR